MDYSLDLKLQNKKNKAHTAKKEAVNKIERAMKAGNKIKIYKTDYFNDEIEELDVFYITKEREIVHEDLEQKILVIPFFSIMRYEKGCGKNIYQDYDVCFYPTFRSETLYFETRLQAMNFLIQRALHRLELKKKLTGSILCEEAIIENIKKYIKKTELYFCTQCTKKANKIDLLFPLEKIICPVCSLVCLHQDDPKRTERTYEGGFGETLNYICPVCKKETFITEAHKKDYLVCGHCENIEDKRFDQIKTGRNNPFRSGYDKRGARLHTGISYYFTIDEISRHYSLENPPEIEEVIPNLLEQISNDEAIKDVPIRHFPIKVTITKVNSKTDDDKILGAFELNPIKFITLNTKEINNDKE